MGWRSKVPHPPRPGIEDAARMKHLGLNNGVADIKDMVLGNTNPRQNKEREKRIGLSEICRNAKQTKTRRQFTHVQLQ